MKHFKNKTAEKFILIELPDSGYPKVTAQNVSEAEMKLSVDVLSFYKGIKPSAAFKPLKGKFYSPENRPATEKDGSYKPRYRAGAGIRITDPSKVDISED